MKMTGQRRPALLPRRLSEWRGSSHYRTGAPLIPHPLVRNEARGQPVNSTLEASWTELVSFLTWTTTSMFGFLARLSDTWTTPSSNSIWPVSAFMTMSRLFPGLKLVFTFAMFATFICYMLHYVPGEIEKYFNYYALCGKYLLQCLLLTFNLSQKCNLVF